jgi:hypothetical protein
MPKEFKLVREMRAGRAALGRSRRVRLEKLSV